MKISTQGLRCKAPTKWPACDISSTPNRHPPRRHPGNLLNVCSREWLSASQFVDSRYFFFVGKNRSFPLTQNHCGPKKDSADISWNKTPKRVADYNDNFFGVSSFGWGSRPQNGNWLKILGCHRYGICFPFVSAFWVPIILSLGYPPCSWYLSSWEIKAFTGIGHLRRFAVQNKWGNDIARR